MAVADCLPVVQRELREGARRPFNYWLRVAGAAAGVLLLYAINQDADGNVTTEGLRLFTGLHTMLLALICIIVPAMSADCIAREKREGTLGLLFLTPLNAMGVVTGKALVQMFRAFTLWVAMLPVIVIPFIAGGVTGGDVASAVIIEFCVTLLCLAAGILASTLAKARSTAFILAACFALAFVCLFSGLLGMCFFGRTSAPGRSVRMIPVIESGQSLITGQPDGGVSLASSRRIRGPFVSRVAGNVIIGAPTYAGFTSGNMSWSSATFQSQFGWGPYFSAPATSNVWRSLLLESGLAAPLLFLLVLLVAARRMEDSWQDQPPSLRREGWVKTFCVPLAKARFARKMRRTLEWNPIAWLQQYSWKARVSKWGLCLGFVLLECAATYTGNVSDMLNAQYFMLLILASAFTFVGVNSFLTEKKSGALELLLVTPVSPNQIIFGRVWGLWKQFLPAGMTLLLVALAAQSLYSMAFGWLDAQYPSQDNGITVWSLLTSPLNWGYSPTVFFASGYFERDNLIILSRSPFFRIFVIAAGFFTLPVFATSSALRFKNLIVAAALTWAVLLLCPFSAFCALSFLHVIFHVQPGMASLYVAVIAANFLFALLACSFVHRSLSRRIYSF